MVSQFEVRCLGMRLTGMESTLPDAVKLVVANLQKMYVH